MQLDIKLMIKCYMIMNLIVKWINIFIIGLIQTFRKIKFDLNETIDGFYNNIFKESENTVRNLLNDENYIL